MSIFMRYVLEIAIIIPDAVFLFLPVIEELRWRKLVTYSVSGVLLPVFVVIAASVSSSERLPVIPVLVVSVIFLFLLFFFSVKVTLGRKLFCFFNAIMLGAFSLLYAIALMASREAGNELWEATRLMSMESGLVSLVLSLVIGCVFFRMLTEELPMLLKEERVNGMWDFLFLLPLGATVLIWWMVPVYPNLLLIARAQIIFLVLLPLIPLVILLIYYLLWWMATRFSESARLQEENTLLTMESKRYEELRNYMEETRALRHDFRQHILVITQLSGAEKFSELQKYLQQFSETAERKYTGYCGNLAVDAVASYYASYAERHRATIEWRLNLPPELPLKESEYCVILGNLLENALRAVKNLAEGRRKITVISSLVSPTIIGLSVDNPYSGQVRFSSNGLPLSDRKGHGMGLTSVRNTIKRYGGTMEITAEQNKFSVDIVLHCNTI